jgi:hypothetical protein
MKKSEDNKTFTLSMRLYSRYLTDFINYKETFTVTMDGSTIIINCKDNIWKFIDYGGISGKGYHLAKFVLADAKKYYEAHPEERKAKQVDKLFTTIDNVDLEVQKVNLSGVKKYLGEQIYSVDVNNCYWETAYKMGVISTATYNMGLRKKEWKIGRNASIGNLAKVKTETKFVNGEKIETEIIRAEDDLSFIRDKIVREVHGRFLPILEELKDDWIMYFTDCVYLPINKVEPIRDYFKKIGYETKVDTYQLDSFDENDKKVTWFDYQKNKIKYFKFTDRQFSLTPQPIFKVRNS